MIRTVLPNQVPAPIRTSSGCTERAVWDATKSADQPSKKDIKRGIDAGGEKSGWSGSRRTQRAEKLLKHASGWHQPPHGLERINRCRTSRSRRATNQPRESPGATIAPAWRSLARHSIPLGAAEPRRAPGRTPAWSAGSQPATSASSFPQTRVTDPEGKPALTNVETKGLGPEI